MLKIGVLGAGHLGKIHLSCIQQLKSEFDLVGFYDPNEEKALEAEQQFQIKPLGSVNELIDACEVVDVVTPTLSHFDCSIAAVRKGRHVFIEKPITNTLEEAKKLMDVALEAKVKVQVGHVERFNPAFLAAIDHIAQPMFIEAHRLAEFNPRGTDVSVVLDLMIHDIDIVLSIVKANLRKISASGVAVVSESPDICNARLEFDNGCVANLTASRISLKNMRKSRIFQKDAYVSVDFLHKKVEIVRIKPADKNDPFALILPMEEGKDDKQIIFEHPEVEQNNAILEELRSFASSIKNNSQPRVDIDDGYRALNVAHQILSQLDVANTIFAP